MYHNLDKVISIRRFLDVSGRIASGQQDRDQKDEPDPGPATFPVTGFRAHGLVGL